MYDTQNQQAFESVLNEFVKVHHELDGNHAYAAGFLVSMAVEMLNDMPKRKQKEIIKRVQANTDSQPIKVISIMSGKEVTIPRGDRGTCSDPSMERHWTM